MEGKFLVVMLLAGAVAAMRNSPLEDEGISRYVTFRPLTNYFITWQGSLEVNLVKNRILKRLFQVQRCQAFRLVLSWSGFCHIDRDGHEF